MYQEYFQNPSDEITDPDLTLEGHHKELSLDTISTCGANNSDCQEKLSLSMWMKNDVPKYSKETPSSSRRGIFHILFVISFTKAGSNKDESKRLA